VLLVLDIGNTQTSFGIFDRGKLTHHWRAETQIAKTADEYASFLFPLLAHARIPVEDCDGIAICSVVPPAEESFTYFCRQYLNKEPYLVSCQSKLNFSIEVETPSEVGADRLANTAYAIQNMKLPAIVVDLGTATTFDVVTADKGYQGGIILPGVRMGAEALSRRTSLLPLIDVQFPQTVIGKNTTQCIQSGILFGYCDVIDGLLERLQRELGCKCEIALTGGLAPLFHPRIKNASTLLPDLTLEGTSLLYRLNVPELGR